MLDDNHLRFNPWPKTTWQPKEKPVVIIDGEKVTANNWASRISGRAAYVVGASDEHMHSICQALSVQYLCFYEMRVTDLTPLLLIPELQHLSIRWNTKLINLSPVGELNGLKTLILENTPKAQDLRPIGSLRELLALEFSGGIDTKNVACSLQSLGQLHNLVELRLLNLKISSGGLRPLAQCQNLRSLSISNQFPTDEYAYLSVMLPSTVCSHFSAWIPIQPINGKDRMVTGSRKPFLNSNTDREKLAHYEREFARLQHHYAT